ncbi:MAG: hypothetical protein RBJ76_13540 [Stenomitos frigidus ULC029]
MADTPRRQPRKAKTEPRTESTRAKRTQAIQKMSGEDFDQKPISLQEVVNLTIERLGYETNNKNHNTGNFSNLRALAERSGVSRTAIGHVADGRTRYMSEVNVQKICTVIGELDPPIINPHTGEPLPTDWLTIVSLNSQALAQKATEPEALPPEDQAAPVVEGDEEKEPTKKEILQMLMKLAEKL